MKKEILVVSFVFTLISIRVVAQSDTISLFRDNVVKSTEGTKQFNNVLFINFGTLFRGGFALGYERHFTFTGWAFYGHLAYTSRDFTGQYLINEGNSIFHNSETFKGGLKPGYLYEGGMKYYFEKAPEDYYISLAYTMVKNTRVRDLRDEFTPMNLSSNSYDVKYKSKEVKFMFGYVASSSQRFYSDVSFGAGFRFLKFDDVKFTTIEASSEENDYRPVKWYSKTVKKDSKPWLFFSYKIGYRF